MSDPRVEVMAYTMLTQQAEKILSTQPGVEDADHLAELTGRDCYQSHDRPNPLTAKTEDYIQRNLVGKQHFSVLEHGTVTIRFTNVSRSFTHELVRHRHFSFSQLSQRYVTPEDQQYVVPPEIRDWPNDGQRARLMQLLDEAWDKALETYAEIEEILSSAKNLSSKRIRQASRSVMPNMTDTIINVTGNHRAWREFLEKRLGVSPSGEPHADLEMFEVAMAVLGELKKIAPATYADFE
ncbi:MAG: FAD-dependent thymidylate synthase [Nitrospira sp.]